MVKNSIKKDTINLDFVHTLLLQSLQISSPKDIEVPVPHVSLMQDLVSLFKEQIHQLVHTKDGAHAACLLLSYATAKDRKSMVKALKEVVPRMPTDQHAHMVLIVLFAVVDDTKLVGKAVLSELKDSWGDIARDKFGRKVVLFLCREDTKDAMVKECRENSASTRYYGAGRG
jgi:pumilio homology domain family member 6